MLTEYEYLDVQLEDEVAIIRLADLQFFNTDDYLNLQEEFLLFTEDVRPPLLVVEFLHVTYCPTILISGLLGIQERLAKYGGELKLSRLSPGVRDMFRSLRLDQSVFSIYETTGAALVDH